MIKIVGGHLAHQRNQTGKIWNTKLCLSNHIPVRDADWFKCHFRHLCFKADWFKCNFWQLCFKAHWSKFTSFLSCHFFLRLCFHFGSKHVDFTWLTRAKKRSAAKSDENIIVEGERNIKVGSGSLSSPMREHRNFAQFYCISVTNFSTFSECSYWNLYE